MSFLDHFSARSSYGSSHPTVSPCFLVYKAPSFACSHFLLTSALEEGEAKTVVYPFNTRRPGK